MIAFALCAGAASLVIAPLTPTTTGLTHGITVIAIAALLIWGPRRREPLDHTRSLLVAALVAVLVSELMLVAYEGITGYAPASPWVGDLVSFLYTPLTIAGLLLVPVARDVAGHRVRALSDGVFAAASLWFIVAALTSRSVAHGVTQGPLADTYSLLIAAGDVCVVATALTVLARCSLAVARTIAGIAAGITVIAVDDIWLLVTGHSGYSVLSVTLVQFGLLLLLVTAGLPPIQSRASMERTQSVRRWFSILPFVPMFAVVGVAVAAAITGHGVPQREVVPATVMAIALIVRQYSTTRERQQLVGELRQRELALQGELRRDALTGLANRLSLMERLHTVLADPRQWPIGVAVLDLNDFKFINDNHGHAVGDEVLRAAATRLAHAVRAEDLIVRLGGDEFAVVSTRLKAEHRDRLAQRLLGALEQPLEVGCHRFAVSASVGIVIGQPPDTAGELLAHADAAMYRAKDEKEQSRSTVTFLDGPERMQIIRELLIREAISKPDLAQFPVFYQPIVNLRNGAIYGFEALLRWRHPDYGLIPPDVFIPLAEKAGTIETLGRHVLATAAADLARMDWRHPEARPRMGINVSPHQLNRINYAQTFLKQLEIEGLPAERLTLEVTEQAFARNLRPVEDAVAALADAGIAIAVDDFGTGYATMRYLQRLRPTVLKIDRSFVADMTTSPTSGDLVSALATMALTLGLKVVAEGIETPEQLARLRDLGCQRGQGYLFSPAVPIGEAETLLERPPWAEQWPLASVG